MFNLLHYFYIKLMSVIIVDIITILNRFALW